MTLKLSINRFEEELDQQAVKVERLNTFNRELRSKVDYFIGLIQTMNPMDQTLQGGGQKLMNRFTNGGSTMVVDQQENDEGEYFKDRKSFHTI